MSRTRAKSEEKEEEGAIIESFDISQSVCTRERKSGHCNHRWTERGEGEKNYTGEEEENEKPPEGERIERAECRLPSSLAPSLPQPATDCLV